MKPLATIVLVSGISTSALAEPGAQQACAYFADGLTPEINIAARPLELTKRLAFEQLSVELDRYALFARPEMRVEFGVTTPKGKTLPTAHASWIETCLVDTKDRRVLEVAILPGPSAGSDAPLSNGNNRKVVGATLRALQIGNKVHGGKY